MTRYIGCIDIHAGKVKQIVGGTLQSSTGLATNFVSEKPSSYYADLYKKNNVIRSHVIKLGLSDENDRVALEAIKEWPNHLQVGGGVNDTNAKWWIEQGADKVIITSWLFPDGRFDKGRLERISNIVGRDHLVVDLSCRRRADGEWAVAINKWQTLTSMVLNREVFGMFEQYCSEFLVHAADVEGLCKGIEEELVSKLGEWSRVPVVYAGGAMSVKDLELVERLSRGRVDLTYGSALDIFGGDVKFAELVQVSERVSELPKGV
ncbi:DEKNAAC104011 [Brettanomyces naardenensis]|uniref:1-(5-phosphoribosyl)-5-[(5-phosphoribosylamino)methylideneamino] imidazole-4-carboxamide isomerase n=1 Tax=Brettanomyces naardenensis TaxID=13370 RepID=A0A448YQI6_BRENA|nr:DEKNAAC104011 [Brettanomyces naardenensis]